MHPEWGLGRSRKCGSQWSFPVLDLGAEIDVILICQVIAEKFYLKMGRTLGVVPRAIIVVIGDCRCSRTSQYDISFRRSTQAC